MFQKVTHHKTADAVVWQIEELILKGVLHPGDRLPAERDLSEEIDVSRPVLKDALKLLDERGLLVSRKGDGTYVADVIGPIFSEPVAALIERHPAATADYLEFRRDIEGLTAAHAAERATPADQKILTDIVSQMKTACENADLQREAELDIEFHNAVGEAAHNVILLHNLRSCYRLLENGVFFNRQRLFDHPTARVSLVEQHSVIMDRILAGDATGARTASEGHIDFVQASILEMDRLASRQEVSDLRLKQRRTTTPKTKSAAGRFRTSRSKASTG